VLVTGGVHVPDHLRAGLLERPVHFLDGIAEILPEIPCFLMIRKCTNSNTRVDRGKKKV
jgi:hypothetical protein